MASGGPNVIPSKLRENIELPTMDQPPFEGRLRRRHPLLGGVSRGAVEAPLDELRMSRTHA